MQHLEVSCAVRRLFKSLGFQGLINSVRYTVKTTPQFRQAGRHTTYCCSSTCETANKPKINGELPWSSNTLAHVRVANGWLTYAS